MFQFLVLQKNVVSSVFIIQGKVVTRDARVEWEMHLLLITMPGGEI